MRLGERMQRRTRLWAFTLAGLLTTTLAVAVPVGSAAAAVIARHANLTTRAVGYPTTSNPAQQLQSAAVRQDLQNSTVSGTFTLRAAPPTNESEYGQHGFLSISFGNSDNGTCQADTSYGQFSVSLAGNLNGSGFSRSGRTYTLSKAVSAAGWATWDCAFALTMDEDMEPVDALIGTLGQTQGKPALTVKSVRFLGSTKKPLRLTRGVWTTIEVEVANTGTSDAANVVITGSGKGLKVKKKKVGTVSTVTSTVTEVRVKLKAKRKRSTLKLKVKGDGVTANHKIKVKRVTPKKPVAGRYRDKKRGITFRVRKGRVVQFKGRIQHQCGVWPQYTYNTQQWQFPKTKIGKDGIVERTVRKKDRRLDLRMRIAGRKATQGRFYYSSPGGHCFGSTFFTAKRVGK